MIIFESIMTTFEASTIFEAAGTVVEISLSLQITSCNQVKLAQILDTHCCTLNNDKGQDWPQFRAPKIPGGRNG